MTTAKGADAGPRIQLVLGNWKMFGTLNENAARLTALRRGAGSLQAEMGVCVPFPYLAQAEALLEGSAITWGAQDISTHTEPGAHTGEVSGRMLADFGCTWAIVGHSERRAAHTESDQEVADKAKAALHVGLTPVVCVGETLDERQGGNALGVIERQLEPVLALGTAELNRMVFAYEPIWAIGTGHTATPEQAQEVHSAIRVALRGLGAGNVRVLYGGSVKPANAAELFAMPDIDGALVGGASLVAEDFLRIAAA
jgi:triosephosphate isomerase